MNLNYSFSSSYEEGNFKNGYLHGVHVDSTSLSFFQMGSLKIKISKKIIINL